VSIHALAAVSPQAQIGHNVKIGPFCVVEDDVTIGDGCTLASHVIVKSGTSMGNDNRVFDAAVLGGLPQHVNIPEYPGRVVIGSGNTIREAVTIHRALEQEATTTLGDNNLLMVNSHVAHDCHLGSNVILTNNALLGGHVTAADRAYISGAVAVHQFCRIGSLAMVGGQARIVKDIPPFVTVDGLSSLVVGLNTIGLRRAGFDGAQIQQLKTAYRVIYRSGFSWKEILARLQTEFVDGPAAQFYDFLAATTRGIIGERRMPPGATLKIRREPEEHRQLRAKAG
jgi:UDP-N-acetylglucosamine acyltransferase